MIEIDKILGKTTKMLKPFQSASVDYVIDQLYNNNRNKVLIADEVGLGKTIVARGVVARALSIHMAKDLGRPMNVVYVCSNQVLAQQNISKLNPLETKGESLSRLVYLAFKSKNQSNLLQLSSLTPSTSFEITRGTGVVYERAIIYVLLRQYADLSQYDNELLHMLRGSSREDRWKEQANEYWVNKDSYFRLDVSNKFLNHIKKVIFISKNHSKLPLDSNSKSSIYDLVKVIVQKLKEDISSISSFIEVIAILRRELTVVCLDYLEADLFVLDEFQRFKSLLNTDDESPANRIARKVLQNDEEKVILLSATPFKPYTNRLDQLNGEHHHNELESIVKFLGGNKGDALWNQFSIDQRRFFEILQNPKLAIDNQELAFSAKSQLENTFKKFISRNERLSVAENYNNMTAEHKNPLSIHSDDVTNFIQIDHLIRDVQNIYQGNARYGSMLEFSKSVTYPLSFLIGYKLHGILHKELSDEDRKDLFQKHQYAFIKNSTIDGYKRIGKNTPMPNSKFRLLLEESMGTDTKSGLNGEQLLWIPPTLPYYKFGRPFKEAIDFSKVLIFSNWAMVPRAIASLVSYEAERRVINVKTIQRYYKKNPLRYFNRSKNDSNDIEAEEVKQKTKKIYQLLTYKNSKTDGRTQRSMSNFTLSYPSEVYRSICVLDQLDMATVGNLSYHDIRDSQKKLLLNEISKHDILKTHVASDQREDSTWYWVLGTLLDRLNNPKDVHNIITRESIAVHLRTSKETKSTSSKSTAKNLLECIDHLNNTVDNIISGEYKLGRQPEDLLDVIADIILASPAQAFLRAVHIHYPNESSEQNKNYCFYFANSFFSILDKPESILAIKSKSIYSSKGGEQPHWKRCLSYSASGNIHAMIEEYLYMLKNCAGANDLNKLQKNLDNVLNVSTSSISVDLYTTSGNVVQRNMRTHYAVAYGAQKSQSDAGDNRMMNLRDGFNSPFRPFVLASTSVGQEGLDFHFYCKKIFHWNLPHNAIDLEQREGRINRYKGLVIRKKIAELIELGDIDNQNKSIWESIFEYAESYYSNDTSGIKPNWYIDDGESNIERFVPTYPMSKDITKYKDLVNVLALYRMTFGQPRQDELIEAWKAENLQSKEIDSLRKKLMINLSPMKI